MILPLIIIVLSCRHIISCLSLSFDLDGLDVDHIRLILRYVHIRIPEHNERIPAVDNELYNLARFLKALTTRFSDISIKSNYTLTDENVIERLVSYLNNEELGYLARELLPINSINPNLTFKNWLKILSQPSMRHIFDNLDICSPLWVPISWKSQHVRILLKKLASDQLYRIRSKGFCCSLASSTKKLKKLFKDDGNGHDDGIWLLFDHFCVLRINSHYTMLQPLLKHLMQLSKSNDLAFFRLVFLRFFRRDVKAAIDRYLVSMPSRTKEQQPIITITNPYRQDSKSLIDSYNQARAHLLSLLETNPSKEQAAMFELELFYLGLCQNIFDQSEITGQFRQMFVKHSPRVAPPYLIKELLIKKQSRSLDFIEEIQEWKEVLHGPDRQNYLPDSWQFYKDFQL